MMRRVLATVLRVRLLVLIAAVGLLTAGVARAHTIPIDTYPEFTPPYVEVQTEALGLSADEVEQLITVPLEADLLAGVAWLDSIRSESIAGLSSIFLLFQPGTNLLRARQMVSERLNQPAALPSVSKPPVMLPPLSSTSRTMMIALSSKKTSLLDVGVLARWTMKPRLLGVPGVANVTIWGHRERQLQVQVDPNQLQAHNVSLSQIQGTAGNALWVSPLTFLEASSPGAGGFFDSPNQRLQVRHVSPIVTADDLSRVAVESAEDKSAPTAADGKTLRLGDVASVVEDHQPLIGDAVINGVSGIMLVVEKLPDANTLEVTRGVEKALKDMKAGLAGIDVDTSVYRPATFIHRATHDLSITLMIGGLLALIALALLFYEWRTAIIAIVAVASSVVAALVVLALRGVTLNALVFAGLVVAAGLVIDEAVLSVDSIARRVSQRRPETSAASAVISAVIDQRRTLMFAAGVVLLPLVPIMFLTDLGHAFGRPLALSYLIALLASTVVALTITPSLATVLFKGEAKARRESPFLRWVGGGYTRMATGFVRTPRVALATIAVVLVAGLVTLPTLRHSPVPLFKEPNLVVSVDAPPGSSLTEMDRLTGQMSGELSKLRGVESVAGHVGRAIQSDRVVSPDSANLWINLEPKADYEKTVASVRSVLRGYPGVDSDVVTYPQEKFRELKTGADDPVVVRVYGADLNVLRPKAAEVQKALRGVKGLTGVTAEFPAMAPTLQVDVDLEKAKAAGVKPGDIRRAATTLLSGLLVGNTFENQKVFEVVVLGTPSTRESLNSARDLTIDTADGGHVRLGDVAAVAIKPAPSVIERDSVSRFLDVTAGIHGRSRGAVLADVRQRLENVSFPLEYHYELVGNYAQHQAAHQRVVLAALGALIAIFLVIQAAVGSGRLAAILFLSLPLSLAGGVIAVRLDGGDVEFGALVGFLAVFAIAVRSGIILIRHYQQLESRELAVFGPDLVVTGARERLAPTLTTMLTTGVFFLPFVVRGDLAGHEIVNPMGGVILGGLVTTAVVTLFVLPSMYLRFGSGQSEAGVLDLRDIWNIDADDVLIEGEVGAITHHAGNGENKHEVIIDLAAPEARTE